MSKKMHDENEPFGTVERVVDFLPSPSQLVPRDDNVKVTLSLSRESVDFFKQVAKQNSVPYQRMIRNLIDQYTQQHRR
jgi:predicted DNA binding CopG/RHH family protein